MKIERALNAVGRFMQRVIERLRGRFFIICVVSLAAVLIAAGVFFRRFWQDPTGVSEVRDDSTYAVADRVERLRSLPYVSGRQTDKDEPGGVIFFDEERSCSGYNLYGAEPLTLAELIDSKGGVVNSWNIPLSGSWANCELLPNGDLLVVGSEHPSRVRERPFQVMDDDRYVLRFDWRGKILWKRSLQAHHDIEVTPDGKLVVLTFRRVLVPRIHPKIEVRDDQLTLLNQSGETITSHSMLEAVIRNSRVFPLQRTQVNTLGGPPWVDIFHSNSVEWMHYEHLVGKHPIYDPQNILVCFRHQNCIAVFNWNRNDVVWAWGEDELSGPHDAQVLENGNITVFDNGLVRGYSRVIELDPQTEKIVWEYKADPPDSFYTISRGSAQRLPNGNTLMAESDKGRAFEVTPGGEVVWEFICPHKIETGKRSAISRIKRYPREYIQAILDRHQE